MDDSERLHNLLATGPDWDDVTGDQALEVHGELVLTLAQVFPEVADRDRVAEIWEALLEKNAKIQSFSTPQRGYLWERYNLVLDLAYYLADHRS